MKITWHNSIFRLWHCEKRFIVIYASYVRREDDCYKFLKSRFISFRMCFHINVYTYEFDSCRTRGRRIYLIFSLVVSCQQTIIFIACQTHKYTRKTPEIGKSKVEHNKYLLHECKIALLFDCRSIGFKLKNICAALASTKNWRNK